MEKNYNIEYQKYMTVTNVLCEISNSIELKKCQTSEDLNKIKEKLEYSKRHAEIAEMMFTDKLFRDGIKSTIISSLVLPAYCIFLKYTKGKKITDNIPSIVAIIAITEFATYHKIKCKTIRKIKKGMDESLTKEYKECESQYNLEKSIKEKIS